MNPWGTTSVFPIRLVFICVYDIILCVVKIILTPLTSAVYIWGSGHSGPPDLAGSSPPPHLCYQDAHTLRISCTVGPASLWYHHISAETRGFCSEHSAGLLSTWPGRARPHPPDTYRSPLPTPARHKTGRKAHIFSYTTAALAGAQSGFHLTLEGTVWGNRPMCFPADTQAAALLLLSVLNLPAYPLTRLFLYKGFCVFLRQEIVSLASEKNTSSPKVWNCSFEDDTGRGVTTQNSKETGTKYETKHEISYCKTVWTQHMPDPVEEANVNSGLIHLQFLS